MHRIEINHLTDDAREVMELANSIARSEHEVRLDLLHVFRAAAILYRQLVKEQAGLCEDALAHVGQEQPPVASQDATTPIDATEQLKRIVGGLTAQRSRVTLESLLAAVLRSPSVRLKALLTKARGLGRAPRRHGSTRDARPRHRSKVDWLMAHRREWAARAAAARTLGLIDTRGYRVDSRDYLADGTIDAVLRISALNREKQLATNRELDPLAHVAGELNYVERAACEAYLVDEFFGLDLHPLGGLSVRDLAQMFSPELYPSNCRRVRLAVDGLRQRGILRRQERDDDDRLTARLYPSSDFVGEVVVGLEADHMSAGELGAVKRQIRIGQEFDLHTLLATEPGYANRKGD